MANVITRNIPNTITSCNLFCGCIASYMAFHSKYELALLFIVLGATFDFFDGMTARLLHVSSPIGKELDSLADDITFGLAPAAIAFSLFKEVHYPDFLLPLSEIMPYTAFLIAVFTDRRCTQFFGVRPFQRLILVHLSSSHVTAAGGRTPDVLPEVQGPVVGT